jgi:formate/nitrite transporter
MRRTIIRHDAPTSNLDTIQFKKSMRAVLLSFLAAATAASAFVARSPPGQQAILRRTGQRATRRTTRTTRTVAMAGESLLFTPAETYHGLVAKGEANSKLSNLKTIHASIMGGLQVGIGGMLCLTICGNMPAVAASNPGIVKFVFGALFPVCLMLVLNTGTQLYTGNTASMASAYCEGKISLGDVAKSWTIAFVGNVIGCGGLAYVGHYTGLLSGGTKAFAAALGLAKCSGGTFGQMLVKGIFCNYLVCMAVYLASMARDMGGRYFGILIPVSTFVATGYEHSVANMMLLPAAMLAGAPLTLRDVIVKNMLPVTIGNGLAGAILVAASFSFQFGKLGEGR